MIRDWEVPEWLFIILLAVTFLLSAVSMSMTIKNARVLGEIDAALVWCIEGIDELRATVDTLKARDQFLFEGIRGHLQWHESQQQPRMFVPGGTHE